MSDQEPLNTIHYHHPSWIRKEIACDNNWRRGKVLPSPQTSIIAFVTCEDCNRFIDECGVDEINKVATHPRHSYKPYR